MIRILTTYYNSFKYLKNTIKSLQFQNNKDWICYICNDCSNDGSELLIQKLIKNDRRFKLINNKKKLWQTGNYYQTIHRSEINDDDICVTIDGDDWLPDTEVLDRVNNYYNDNTLMTFGQFAFYYSKEKPLKIGFTKKPNPFDNLRNLPWTSSHLRTFKAGVFRKVKKDDLLKPDKSDFIEVAGDVVCFTPCLEFVGENNVKYIKDINYIYNMETPLNESKTVLNYSQEIVNYIKQKSKYKRYCN